MSSFGDINRINTNIQALDSQLSLNRVNRGIADNQLRMSTGLRINRAEDDAAGYSIATKLNARVVGLTQALANTGDAKSVLDITESSFNTVMDQLIEMKGLATRAANETLGDIERGFIGQQVTALGKDINEIANQTIFQDYELLNGSGGTHEGNLTLTFQVGERENDTVAVDLAAVNVSSLFEESSARGRESVEVTGAAAALSGTATGSVSSINITVGGQTTTVSLSSPFTGTANSTNLGAIATAVNGAEIRGLTAAVNEAGDGIVFTNTSTEAITVRDSDELTAGVSIAAATTFKEGQGAIDVSGWGASDFRGFIEDVDTAITEMAKRVNTVGIAQSSLSLREVTLSQSISANSSAASRIMDTDFAKEQSESIRLQILQQTATSAFAQANSGPQSVLGYLQ
jgi:flagellin